MPIRPPAGPRSRSPRSAIARPARIVRGGRCGAGHIGPARRAARTGAARSAPCARDSPAGRRLPGCSGHGGPAARSWRAAPGPAARRPGARSPPVSLCGAIPESRCPGWLHVPLTHLQAIRDDRPTMPGTRSDLAIQAPQRPHRRRCDHHASRRWPGPEEVTITWRGSCGYLTGDLGISVGAGCCLPSLGPLPLPLQHLA